MTDVAVHSTLDARGDSRNPASSLLHAKSIVVIGASASASKAGGRPHRILDKLGFSGEVFLVNKRHAEPIDGLHVYSDVSELPSVPDLAIVCLPASGVVQAIEACASKGIGAAVVFSNGFAESGDTGLQNALLDAAAGSVRLLGPNCLGFANFNNGVAGTFSSYLLQRDITPGSSVALVTQSGALGNSLLLSFSELQVDLQAWAATGNEADLTITDFVEAFVEDQHTRLVVTCVESLKDGHRWVDIARRARDRGKKILVVKGGASERSQALALSHSGKLLGSHVLWTEFADQLGLVSVETVNDLADVTHVGHCLQGIDFDPAKGGLGIVTSSGGLGVLLSDSCERNGVKLADLERATRDELVSALPVGASVHNPVDPTPVTDEAYLGAARTLLSDKGVGIVLVILQSLSRDYGSVAGRVADLAEFASQRNKVVAISYLAENDRLPADVEGSLRRGGVIVLPSPDRVIRAWGRLIGMPKSLDSHSSTESVATPPTAVPWREVAPWLEQVGLPVVQSATLTSAADARSFLEQVRAPVVLKIDDPAVAHKSDVGGVILNIADPGQIVDAYHKLAALGSEDAVVVGQKQVEGGLEVLVSVRRDAELGVVLSVGWGGIYTNLISDIVSAPCPLTSEEARRLVTRSRIGELLLGFRGDCGYDIDALCVLLERLSQVFSAQDRYREIEINPVRVLRDGHGCVIVDALVLPV
jgi:acetate---CoA ligase (ADP-forming)